MNDSEVLAFERLRPRLLGMAYRMIGARSDSEDIVQEAYLRWHDTDRALVRDPAAFLLKVVARLALDQLKSARARRENYVGPWLPEPITDTSSFASGGAGELADELSLAFLLALERLSPLERAAFLLHDIFAFDFGEIAELIEREPAACRQLASRAREHVRDARPRFSLSPEASAKLTSLFLEAARTGDVHALASVLAEEAILHSDGGGKRRAALAPIRGADKIARFFAGISPKHRALAGYAAIPTTINGSPGVILQAPDGALQTLSIEFAGDRIGAIYIVLNPEKLTRLEALPGSAAIGGPEPKHM